MKRILITCLAFAAIVFACQAVIIPYGVQQNVPVSTVTGTWGWQVAYQGTYGTFDVPISTIFAGVSPGDYVMYAAKPVGSSTFTLLAAAPEASARTQTAHNMTTTANGAEWYYNGYSIGFAGLGNTIDQNTADVSGFDSQLRLSWHGGVGQPGYSPNVNQAPLDIDGGWRAGATTGLNFSSSWERYVLYATPDPVAIVPEPSTIFLLGVGGLIGWRAWQHKRRQGRHHTGGSSLTHRIVFVILVGLGLVAAYPAGAVLLDFDLINPGDALVTRDTSTGLEWLDIPATVGQTYNAIAGGYGGYTTTYGFRFASVAEFNTLIANLGLVQGYNLPSGQSGAVLDLLNHLGYVNYFTIHLSMDSSMRSTATWQQPTFPRGFVTPTCPPCSRVISLIFKPVFSVECIPILLPAT